MIMGWGWVTSARVRGSRPIPHARRAPSRTSLSSLCAAMTLLDCFTAEDELLLAAPRKAATQFIIVAHHIPRVVPP